MKKLSELSTSLLNRLKHDKIATMEDLKKIIGTQSRMTVFRRLKELHYITSYIMDGLFQTSS